MLIILLVTQHQHIAATHPRMERIKKVSDESTTFYYSLKKTSISRRKTMMSRFTEVTVKWNTLTLKHDLTMNEQQCVVVCFEGGGGAPSLWDAEILGQLHHYLKKRYKNSTWALSIWWYSVLIFYIILWTLYLFVFKVKLVFSFVIPSIKRDHFFRIRSQKLSKHLKTSEY